MGENMIRTRKSRAVAALVAGALVIAACGGDDDDSGDDAGTAEPADEPADDGGDEPADDGGEEPADDGGDEPADDGGDEPADDGGEEPASEMDDSDMAPQRGGVLTYLLEAESDTWDIPGANCAAACITVMRAVADPMLIVNSDNELEPFLVESFDVNDDFTEWTFTMRPGVTFHDGTPVDGAALQKNLIEMASGTLQGQVFWDLANGSLFSDPPGSPADSIELVDDMTVKVSFAVPVATFGYALAERTGWVFAPSFWDNPDRAGALAVSTGPFMMTEQVRGEVTRTVANPNYWRTDANGEALPYLDGVDFRPVPDSDARLATMQAGDAELNQDSAGENTEFWELEWTETDGNGIAPKAEDREVNYLMFNHAKPPFDNFDFRRAVALCTDRQEVIDFRAPASEVQDGP
ncbi:MAG: ABC transporter substrate-binding protein, partial [Ilumatobacteraceae bacterium]